MLTFTVKTQPLSFFWKVAGNRVFFRFLKHITYVIRTLYVLDFKWALQPKAVCGLKSNG